MGPVFFYVAGAGHLYRVGQGSCPRGMMVE
ncbi:hypothetical protein JOC95_003569 [Bacillus tianshenii]|uniref:Uncharacterized protein n=1 Tax=Sutcliffiella tianshenii TaxID=1463404 RepID=A0ABS2P5K6_9BACI|nr:hypothetical protein [Bacillus tianshenii]